MPVTQPARAARPADIAGSAAPGMAITVLGPVAVRYHGRPIALGSRRQRFVLAVLALEVNRPVPVERLIELVWEGEAPRTAGHAIEVCVSGLRSALTAAGVSADVAELHRDGPAYRLTADANCVDAHRFLRYLSLTGARTDGERVARLTEALALWTGPPLTGTAEPELAERLCRGLLEARWGAVEDRIEARLRIGEHAQVLGELADLTETHPERERSVVQYVTALYRCGRAVEALAFIRAYRLRLAERLGLVPGAAMGRMEQAILRHDPALLAPAAPDAQAPASPEAKASAPPDTRASASPEVTAPVSAAPPAVARPTPRQLPLDLPTFAGRRDDLARLAAALDRADAGTVIVALSGTAGVGKTTLAVHWAHRIADRFPDGQLYLNLRGFGGGPALTATVALRQALAALGVAPGEIPRELDARSALFRSTLAGRRLLVVLDNARDADHARPLLPGAPGSMALVTSRTSLVGLVAAEGATHLPLDVLGPADARELLAARIGGDLVATQPEAVEEIITRCARLPLALAVAAAKMGSDVRRLAAELRAAAGPLSALELPDTSVQAVLRWSYRALTEPAARVFRLLGCHPGLDLTEFSAASLARLNLATARRCLRELLDANLLTEQTPGRYTCHDLLRAYAAGCAQEQESKASRLAAARRVIEHYLHTAYAADRLVHPPRPSLALAPAPAGVAVPDLADAPAGWAWLTAEHANLLAAQRHAVGQAPTEPHWSPLIWQLASVMLTLLQRQGHPQDLYRTSQAALAALDPDDPPMLRVTMLRHVAEACARMDNFAEALRYLHQALSLTDEPAGGSRPVRRSPAGDDDTRLLNRLEVLRTLARTHGRNGDDRAALHEATRALKLSHQLGRADRMASAANAAGWYAARLGEYDTATEHLSLALTVAREQGDRLTESHTLHSQGYVAQRRGRPAEAVALLHECLRLARNNGDSYHEATTLRDLGDCYALIGRADHAVSNWRRALPLFDAQSRATEAAAVRSKLDQDRRPPVPFTGAPS